jgi:hypothetical protein
MLAIYFPYPLYKIAEGGYIRLRNVRTQMSQNFGSGHLSKVLFSLTRDLTPKDTTNRFAAIAALIRALRLTLHSSFATLTFLGGIHL